MKDIDKVEKGINNYLKENKAIFTIQELLGNTDGFVYGGAVRDSLAELPIQDIDIICYSRTRNHLITFLETHNFEIESNQELDELYHGIKLFHFPLLFTNGSAYIHIIQLNPDHKLTNVYRFGDNVVEYRKSQERVIANVDIDICGVYYNPYTGVVEVVPGAIINILKKQFISMPDNIMHLPGRAEQRIKKLEDRGFKNITGKMDQIREYLIEDIHKLPNKDIYKLYKYVRRYLIAKIEGLEDPLAQDKKEKKVNEMEIIERNLIKLLNILAWNLKEESMGYYIYYNKKLKETIYLPQKDINLSNNKIKSILDTIAMLHNLNIKNLESALNLFDTTILDDRKLKEIINKSKNGLV